MKKSKVLKRIASMLTVIVLLTLQFTTVMGAGGEELAYGFDDCKNKGYDTHNWENNYQKSYWRAFAGHNCTNYAAYMLTLQGATTQINGNGANWTTKAISAGYTVNNTPVVGSIAQWNANANKYIGVSGHVAYVEEVTDSYILVSEDNYEKDFRWRKIYKDDLWPSNFIHMPSTELISNEVVLNGKFVICSKLDLNKVVDVGSNDNGEPIIIWSYVPENSSQIFTITHLGNNKHSIINDATGKAVEVSGSTIEEGGIIQQWEYHDIPTMQWKIIEHSNGYYSFVNCNSGLFFDLNNGDSTEGNYFHQWNSNGTDAQLFKLEKVKNTEVEQKKYYVYSGYTYVVNNTRWYTYSKSYALNRGGNSISVTLEYELSKDKIIDGYQSYVYGGQRYYFCETIYK